MPPLKPTNGPEGAAYRPLAKENKQNNLKLIASQKSIRSSKIAKARQSESNSRSEI